MVTTQRHSVDEDQTFSFKDGQLHLHWNGNISATLLGGRDICEFHLLSQRQQDIPEDSAVGSVVSRPVVGGDDHIPVLQHQNEVSVLPSYIVSGEHCHERKALL